MASGPAENFVKARGVQEFQAPSLQLLGRRPFETLLRPRRQCPEALGELGPEDRQLPFRFALGLAALLALPKDFVLH